MSQYLIAIAVGPVQEFIASARKLRDLWYGSYLLSELSKSVARSLSEDSCELIFPAPENREDLQVNSSLNVANKIMVLSPAGTEPDTLVSNAREAYKAYWITLCKKALARTPSGYVDTKSYWLQVDDFGEFYAAWYPYDENNYAECRKKVEGKLSGRKNFRSFCSPTWPGAGKPKSSLDGIRESVINPTAMNDHRTFTVKNGEYLDALGIVKRFGPWTNPTRPYFDNLAQVAIQPYLSGLYRTAIEDPTVADIIAGLPCGQILYPQREQLPPINLEIWDGWPNGLPPELLHPAVLEEEKIENCFQETESAWQDIERNLRKLWKKTTEPQPYAALLLGDGDHMGETLNNISVLDNHKLFSQRLDQFASQVHGVVSDCKGRVIYSGGDDVMAYVPLHQVLDCAQAVNDLFAECMDQACQAIKIEERPTFSIGIVVVHQRNPLDQALNLARKAERYAKQEGGRNSLAIIQDKRSGTELIIHGKWSQQEDLPSLTHRLSRYISAYGNGTLSSRLGYQLRAMEKEYGSTDLSNISGDLDFINGQPNNVLSAETYRIIRHKTTQDQVFERESELLSLIEGQIKLRSICDEMVISHQFSQAEKQSRGVWAHGQGE